MYKLYVAVCIVLCPFMGRAQTCSNTSVIGETLFLNVSQSTPESICIQLNSSTETELEAIRLFVESVNASSRHPVLVTVRQTKGVVSWALPYVESGFSYSSVERILCPLLNSDESGPSALLVDLSTTNPTPLSVSLTTNIISPYRLQLNEPLSLEASPSGPAYLLYEYETPPTESRLRVKFISSDNSSDICAIASIQTAYCPVVELLDNPDHRGRYQTMRSIASINTRENDTEPHFGFFYVVLTVFPNDGRDNSCVFTEQGLGDELITLDSAANNFNPTPYSGPDRTKTVVITVEPELPVISYVIATVVPTILYGIFIIVAVAWIILSDYIRFRRGRIYHLLFKDSNDEVVHEIPSLEIVGTEHSSNDVQAQEESPSANPNDEIDGEQHHLDKPHRPNLLKVLKGSQWGATVNKGSPSPVSPCNGHLGDAGEDKTIEVATSSCGGATSTSLGDVQLREPSTPVAETNPVDRNKFKVNVHLSDLGNFDDSQAVQKEFTNHCLYLLVIIVFYSIPAYQLVITYQRLLTVSGNEDVCYYNSLCAHPWDVYSGLSLSAFNNIFSNIGYVVLGVLFIYTAYRRRNIYRWYEQHNCSCDDHGKKKGVPQRFGLYYAIGLVMIAQAFMSVAYHLCPSSNNYQFDATFMYVMAVLGTYKVLTSRCPDLNPSLQKNALCLMIIITVVVLGGALFQHTAFRVIFIIVYLVTAFVFSVEVYYRWQITNYSSLKELVCIYKHEGPCPPAHIPKFIVAIVLFIFNAIIAGGIFLAGAVGIDFARYFVLIVLVNFLVSLIYYFVTKLVYRESISFKPIVFFFLALATWVAAIYFFTRDVTDWSVSPALSRDNNVDCLVLGFYDSHDMWHFVSAFALFFSFLIVMTLDDRQEDKHRTTLRAF